MEPVPETEKEKEIPPLPLKTYRWEDLRRARKAGGYPWTHLSKPPLSDDLSTENLEEVLFNTEISEELKYSSNQVSMENIQPIKSLDSSPGSSRKHNDGGEDVGIQIPNFSKEISFDNEEDPLKSEINESSQPVEKFSSYIVLSKNLPTKSILKKPKFEKTKCCHTLVNKIKYFADKIPRKHEKSYNSEDIFANEFTQEIRNLKSSPTASKRQKFSAIKLGDSDEMSQMLNGNNDLKEHEYEDVEVLKQSVKFDNNENINNTEEKERKISPEKKSITSQDPSLVVDNVSLKNEEHIMEALHKNQNNENMPSIFYKNKDEEYKNEQPLNSYCNFPIIFNASPSSNVDKKAADGLAEQADSTNIQLTLDLNGHENMVENEWSQNNSDHEYEKMGQSAESLNVTKTFDNLFAQSLVTNEMLHKESKLNQNESVEREENDLSKYVPEYDEQLHPSNASSRTECEISTSQVDSSALENLPLKKESRKNYFLSSGKLIHKHFKEGKEKIEVQAEKLKSKFHNMKKKPSEESDDTESSYRPAQKKIAFSKLSSTNRAKSAMPNKRKFSLPERPDFKKMNLKQKFSFGNPSKTCTQDKKFIDKIDFTKFNFLNKPKLNINKAFTDKIKSDNDTSNENSNIESKTFPRWFHKKKKSEIVRASSSPFVNNTYVEETPVFEFVKFKNNKSTSQQSFGEGTKTNDYSDTEDFSTFNYRIKKSSSEYIPVEQADLNYRHSATSLSMISFDHTKPNSAPVISEIDGDEFFVRRRGISRENIEVREYLNNEIRQAFKSSQSALTLPDEKYRETEQKEKKYDSIEECHTNTENISIEHQNIAPMKPLRKKDSMKNSSYEYHSDYDTKMSFVAENYKQPEDYNLTKSYSNCDSTNNLQNTDSSLVHDISDVMQIHQNNKKPIPLPPKRNKKFTKNDHDSYSQSSLKTSNLEDDYDEPDREFDEIAVYRTEYTIPKSENTIVDQSPVTPRWTNSRSSYRTSICDDDCTSHGAESLTLDTQTPHVENYENIEKRRKSPDYAIVDKGVTKEKMNISLNELNELEPPIRRRKSNSSERKYKSVLKNGSIPKRPPRKKSSASLMTLNSYSNQFSCEEQTQYAEIKENNYVNKAVISSEATYRMKDRPLPPPPRPPRESKKNKLSKINHNKKVESESKSSKLNNNYYIDDIDQNNDEIDVYTQTDEIAADTEFDDNIDFMTDSLRDIDEISHISRLTSRSEKSFKCSDPKISELSKTNVGRTSPTVILVERRVSSPTKINHQDEMLTEASLTVQPIDIDEWKIPEVPPLPRSRVNKKVTCGKKSVQNNKNHEKSPEKTNDVQLENLITQRLQVTDLDVSRLNVSELQAQKIFVSNVEGVTIQVSELNSKSGHLSVTGMELSQSVIDEIVKKVSELSAHRDLRIPPENNLEPNKFENVGSQSQETSVSNNASAEKTTEISTDLSPSQEAPKRPPTPDLGLLKSYFPDALQVSHPSRLNERPFAEDSDPKNSAPLPPHRRIKRRAPIAYSDSSSEEENRLRHSPRRALVPIKAREPSITEAGAQFLRVCQNNITRAIRNVFNSLVTYLGGNRNKKDVQVLLVIVLIILTGLIIYGGSDTRIVHYHHWEFFNPPDNKQ